MCGIVGYLGGNKAWNFSRRIIKLEYRIWFPGIAVMDEGKIDVNKYKGRLMARKAGPNKTVKET